MSSEGFRGVPGVPNGWELVAIRVPMKGEWFLDMQGNPTQADHDRGYVWPIIRKIEAPKKYRPFANGGEYVADRSDGIVDWKHRDRGDGFYSVVSANASLVWVALGENVEVFNWKQAFEKLVFRHIDGSTSPFGVEVTHG